MVLSQARDNQLKLVVQWGNDRSTYLVLQLLGLAGKLELN